MGVVRPIVEDWRGEVLAHHLPGNTMSGAVNRVRARFLMRTAAP